LVPVQPLFRKLTFHHILSGDTGVVGTGHPEDIEPLHPFVSAEDILKRIVEGMPHV
jgi:hypothetical protein